MHIFSWYTTDCALFDYRKVFSGDILRIKKIFEGDLFLNQPKLAALMGSYNWLYARRVFPLDDLLLL